MPPSIERLERDRFWKKRMARWKNAAFLEKKLDNYRSAKAIKNIQTGNRFWTHSYVGRKVSKLRKHN